MNENTQTKTEDALRHQQSSGDGDEGICLHCALHDAYNKWAASMGGGTTDAPLDAEYIGYCTGQFLAEMTNGIADAESREAFTEQFIRAQMVVKNLDDAGPRH